MRSLLLILVLLCLSTRTFSNDRPQLIDSLSADQKTVLYQYGTLKKLASAPQAENFWTQHKQLMPHLANAQRDSLANELLMNVELVYKVKKPSSFRFLERLFTATGLILSFASLIAAYAIIMLIYKYWSVISVFFLRIFAPLFKILFAPRMLTFELLLLGAAGIWFGPSIKDVTIRTIIIHVGLFLLWSQVTELVAAELNFKACYKKVFNSSSEWIPNRSTFIQICVPCFTTAVALFITTTKIADEWYYYELVIIGLITFYTIPLVYSVCRPLGRLILPVTYELNKINPRILPYITLTIILGVISLFIPNIHRSIPLTLGVLSACWLLIISSKEASGDLISNYVYVQLVSMLYFIGCMFAGAILSMQLLSTIGVLFLVVFAIIKYWELPGFWNWYWKDYKTWGLLGMAAFLWLIATLIKYGSTFIFIGL
ncbi:hypothetical protein [Solitalea canadensis]|uniref:Uncharacterized protein n=1 Tax=Solitalea canadensis (strain ATCC 29591 / DSM 3403 / JCM 21819 / LMG 8368 / NBRC 15130 / NCIMB 12057 / USAM 9D) TaxID=929556 RepID=H8KWG1_SOLCM|nr:hypothetical protein [Solitalea canadensis]AFD08079.1 hypothetical protein Solca_3062 [Solitalea canadensis DSM 3403]